MSIQSDLQSTIELLSGKGKGVLAADESTATIGKRFAALGIECTEESRRAYREMLMSTPSISEYVCGVILYEETLKQKNASGMPFPDYLKSNNIAPGIKVDKGLIVEPSTLNEQVTQGLDGLSDRLTEYKTQYGARFAKWRAVYAISDQTPSSLVIQLNASALARYAAICHSVGIVPIVEPEVLIDGAHSLKQCEDVSLAVFHAVFHAMHQHHVKLEHIILKPSMVIAGKQHSVRSSVQEVAEATMRVLRETVPSAVPSINFLSGGQTSEQATQHLNAMNQMGSLPWNLSFSYARALQNNAMEAWKGQASNVQNAQREFLKRAKLNSLASQGLYRLEMEKDAVLA